MFASMLYMFINIESVLISPNTRAGTTSGSAMFAMFINIVSMLISPNTRAGSARAPLRLCSGLSALADPGSHL